MSDLSIRKSGHAGRITLTRPEALNALSHDMALAIQRALDDWRDDSQVQLVIITAEGERAFCAGGDIAAVYHAALTGDHSKVQRFFADEYRMNATIADYPKPIIAFMHGFVMGGGVGVGGHASHRIVGDTTQIAMPEVGIGLIPDVGGTWLLSRAPDRIGEYLAMTGARMGAGDAIHSGFADTYLPESLWPDLIARLEFTGDVTLINGESNPSAPLKALDLSPFSQDSVALVADALEENGDTQTLNLLAGKSPLSMAAGLAMVRAARHDARMQDALAREYRFTYRATQETDFMEGVRAQIIDKDRKPNWKADASIEHVAALLTSLGPYELTWKDPI